MTTTDVLEKMITRDEAIAAADIYRQCSLNLDKIASDVRTAQAQVAAKYEKALGTHTTQRDEAAKTLHNYLAQNRHELLGYKKKSIDFAGVTIGYRKATASLVLLGKKTWDNVLAALKGDAKYAECVATKEEVNKTNLKKLDAKELKVLGVALEQPENFFVNL